MTPPTQQSLYNEEHPRVHREVHDNWRHGAQIIETFLREEDETYWQVFYLRSTDGETNELRDGTARIIQVYPRQINITTYESTPQKCSNDTDNDGNCHNKGGCKKIGGPY